MPKTNHRTDRDILTKAAYATDEHLAVRYQTHELYSHPKVNFPEWVLRTMQWRGDEHVLDIGAGSGAYFELMRLCVPQGQYIAGDLSLGIIQQAQAHAATTQTGLSNFDIQHLPFESNSFDVVLANHMLYHVPDIDHALAEINRVLRPAGCVIAATNSASTMPEFDTLARRACTMLGYPRQRFSPAHTQFSLENGGMRLSHHFRAVARYDFPSAFHFPAVEPVLAYLNSLKALNAFQLPEDITWETFMGVMKTQIDRLIQHFGELQVHKLAGVLIGTNNGGFATEYLQMLDSLAGT